MSLKKFESNDLFLNVMKTNPHCKFSIYNGQTFYRQDYSSKGYTSIYDLHLNNQNYYRYSVKGGSGDRINSVGASGFSATDVGALLSQSYPLTSSISTFYFPASTNASGSQYALADLDRKQIKSIKNILGRYKLSSRYFEYSSSLISYEQNNISLLNIPNIFYGDSIKKGTVKLSIISDGVLLSKVEDIGQNGELIKTTGSTNLSNTKNVAGVVLYDEGLILLFDDTALTSYTESFYRTSVVSTNGDYARWSNWGISANTYQNAVVRTAYEVEFDGVNKIPQLVMLAHAPKAELNHSNNYTFATYNSTSSFSTGSTFFSEKEDIEIKNIAKTEYITPSASFQKETYITKILIYDENKNVIAVAKTSKPVRKLENRDYTFKLKLDL